MNASNKRILIGTVTFGVAIAAMTMVSQSALKPATPEEAAQAFCAAYQAGNDHKIRGLLTAELRAQWDAASEHNDAIQAARPDEKPPLGDGIPVAAFPDAMPECTIGKITKREDSVLVDILHNDPAQPRAAWTDRLVLKTQKNAVLIDDILFPPRGANGTRKALAQALETPVPAPKTGVEPAGGTSAQP